MKIDFVIVFGMTTEIQIQRLSNNSSIRPTETFPEFNLIFRLSNFIHKYKINRGFEKFPFLAFKILSIFIGIEHAINGHKQLSKTWQFFYPKKEKMYRHWTNLFVRYNIELWLDTTFYLPLRNATNEEYFNPIEGFENLKQAILKKKGVLVPTIHIGEFYHTLFSLFHKEIVIDGKKQKIPLVVLGSKENDFLFKEQLKPIKNLKVILTDDFKILKKTVEHYLKKNYTVFLIQDYYFPNQLRTPFYYNSKNTKSSKNSNFLIPCPQMITHFHLNLGCPIIPVIAIPKHNLKHSRVKFLPEICPQTMDISKENEKLKNEIINFRNNALTKKQRYGLISLLINRELYPYVFKYPYLWQEAFLFFDRTKFRIQLKDIKSYVELLHTILVKLKLFIKKTYEPGRKDSKILQIIGGIELDLENFEQDPNEELQINNKFIELGRMNGRNAISKIILIIKSFQNTNIKTKYKNINEKLDSLRIFF